VLSITTSYYILRKNDSDYNVRSKIKNLLKITQVIDLNINDIKDSLNSNFRDFEDATQYY
jgi:hypothetical protein